MTPENLNELQKELLYAGFGEQLNNDLAVEAEKGNSEFNLHLSASYEWIGEIRKPVDLYAQFAPGTNTDKVYLNGVTAAVVQEIRIPFVTTEKDLIKDVLSMFKNPPDPNSLSIDEYQQAIQRQAEDLNPALMRVREIHPNVFNHFIAKFNPILDFELSEQERAAQQKIREDALIMQYFPRFERLSATKIGYLMLGNWVYQEKFNKESKPVKGWIQLDFNAPKTENGNHVYRRVDEKIGYDPAIVLEKFSFADLEFPDNAKIISQKFQSGKFVQLTPTGGQYSSVYASANPQFKSINIYSERGVVLMHNQFKKASFVNAAANNKEDADQQDTSVDKNEEQKLRTDKKVKPEADQVVNRKRRKRDFTKGQDADGQKNKKK